MALFLIIEYAANINEENPYTKAIVPFNTWRKKIADIFIGTKQTILKPLVKYFLAFKARKLLRC